MRNVGLDNAVAAGIISAWYSRLLSIELRYLLANAEIKRLVTPSCVTKEQWPYS